MLDGQPGERPGLLGPGKRHLGFFPRKRESPLGDPWGSGGGRGWASSPSFGTAPLLAIPICFSQSHIASPLCPWAWPEGPAERMGGPA